MKKLRIFESDGTMTLDSFLSEYTNYSPMKKCAFYAWVPDVQVQYVGGEYNVVDGKIGNYDAKSLIEEFDKKFIDIRKIDFESDSYDPYNEFRNILNNMTIFRKVVKESEYGEEDVADYFLNNLFGFSGFDFEGENWFVITRDIDPMGDLDKMYDEIVSAMSGMPMYDRSNEGYY